MVARQNGQQPGAQCVPLMLISAAAVGVAQRATFDPGLVDPGSGKKLCEEGQLCVRRRAGFIVPADMDPPTGRFHGKRLQPRILNANLCPGRLTHRVAPPSRYKPLPVYRCRGFNSSTAECRMIGVTPDSAHTRRLRMAGIRIVYTCASDSNRMGILHQLIGSPKSYMTDS